MATGSSQDVKKPAPQRYSTVYPRTNFFTRILL